MFIWEEQVHFIMQMSQNCVHVQPMKTCVTIHPVTVNQRIHLKTVSVKMSNIT